MPPAGGTKRICGQSSTVFFGLGLLARVGLDVLGGVLAADAVPFVVIKIGRAVLDRPVKVLRVEGHRHLGFDVVDRQPPVELAHRSGIPGIAVRVMGIADAAGQVSVAGHHAEPGHVDVGLLQIALEVFHDVADEPLGLGVVDESGLERRADLHVLLDRHVVLGLAGVDAAEGPFDHLAGRLHSSSVLGRGE